MQAVLQVSRIITQHDNLLPEELAFWTGAAYGLMDSSPDDGCCQVVQLFAQPGQFCCLNQTISYCQRIALICGSKLFTQCNISYGLGALMETCIKQFFESFQLTSTIIFCKNESHCQLKWLISGSVLEKQALGTVLNAAVRYFAIDGEDFPELRQQSGMCRQQRLVQCFHKPRQKTVARVLAFPCPQEGIGSWTLSFNDIPSVQICRSRRYCLLEQCAIYRRYCNTFSFSLCHHLFLNVKLLHLLILQMPFGKAAVAYYGKLHIILGSHFTGNNLASTTSTPLIAIQLKSLSSASLAYLTAVLRLDSRGKLVCWEMAGPGVGK